MTAYVYSIRALGTEEILYVGSTHDIEQRKKQHLNALDKGRHENKTLQKLYDSVGGVVYVKCELAYDDTEIPLRIMEFFYTSMLRPRANRTFNMSNGKKWDNMRLCDSKLAKRIMDVIRSSYSKVI